MNAPEYTILADDTETSSQLSDLPWLRFVDANTSWTQITRPVFVLSRASELGRVSGFVRMANKHQKLRGLFIRADVDPLLLPQFLHSAELRTLRNTLAHSDAAVPKRVIQAWHYGMQDKLIAAAQVVQDSLVVFTCAFTTLKASFKDLKSLRQIPIACRDSFRISSEGSYIHWPSVDVHLDADAIRYSSDDEWRLKQDALRLSEDRRVGAAIRKLRLEKGLRQSDIPGLSDRQLRRVEGGERVTASGLMHLAAAHGLDLRQYMRVLSETSAQTAPS